MTNHVFIAGLRTFNKYALMSVYVDRGYMHVQTFFFLFFFIYFFKEEKKKGGGIRRRSKTRQHVPMKKVGMTFTVYGG